MAKIELPHDHGEQLFGLLENCPTPEEFLELSLLLRQLGPEFYILRQAPLADVGRVAGQWVEEGLRRLRAGQARWTPGYDGVYGKLELLTPE